MTTGRSLRLGEMVLAGGALALGLFIAVETAMLEVASSEVAVGPRLFPSLVAAGLLLVGVALLREAFFGHIAHEGGFELDWPVVGPRAGITGKLVPRPMPSPLPVVTGLRAGTASAPAAAETERAALEVAASSS
jgi:hypothetical protein